VNQTESIGLQIFREELCNKITKRHCIMQNDDHIWWVPESCFSSILEGITLMSNAPSTPQAGANEAPKTPAPGVAAPPAKNQGDKPAAKPAEQQK
jgi:hypothetical protein